MKQPLTTEPPLLNPFHDLFDEIKNLDVTSLKKIQKKMAWTFAWGIPTAEVIYKISKLNPIIEIGAGTGYWSWLLQQANAEIQAFDQNFSAPPHWTKVQEGGPEKINLFPDHNLLVCWPTLGSPFAYHCIDLFTGEFFIYVGEGVNGVTGDPKFFDLLDKKFTLHETIKVPNWPWFKDSVFIYKNKKAQL